MSERPEHNPDCIGCGSRNPCSTGFRVLESGPDRLRARVTLTQAHEGGPGRAHGGMVAVVLDEAIGRLGHHLLDGRDCLTAELRVRYLAPTPVGTSFLVEAQLTRREGRKLWIAGELRDGPDVLAAAEGLMIEARAPEAGDAP